jgi:hypothetical protein
MRWKTGLSLFRSWQSRTAVRVYSDGFNPASRASHSLGQTGRSESWPNLLVNEPDVRSVALGP